VNRYPSWGKYPTSQPTAIISPQSPEYLRPGHLLSGLRDGALLLPRGLGRSYGDSCLNNDHVLLETSKMAQLISFDETTGVLRAEAGFSLAQILAHCVSKGWFLPVSPGTKFVTLGGAVANDIHGKNHHRAGTFGCHVRRFALMRSSGEVLECSSTENSELFCATIGGLGLTGLIIWVEIQMTKIASPFLSTRYTRFRNLNEFYEVSLDQERQFEYTVAWVDCTSEGPHLGRGIYMAGNFTEAQGRSSVSGFSVPFPCEAPSWFLNSAAIRAFNFLYYHQQLTKVKDKLRHYEPYFYPLDRILHWNRMYGRRGLFQYQLVVPNTDGGRAIKEVFQHVARSKRASFLAVLKSFGQTTSPGMLSFPREGTTLVLDFPNDGERTFRLMESLDDIVRSAGGAINPSKDARMPRDMFELSFPRLAEFERLIDPHFSSSFWRRLRG
jgi:FAD/FMN-containing dehydrogenase